MWGWSLMLIATLLAPSAESGVATVTCAFEPLPDVALAPNCCSASSDLPASNSASAVRASHCCGACASSSDCAAYEVLSGGTCDFYARPLRAADLASANGRTLFVNTQNKTDLICDVQCDVDECGVTEVEGDKLALEIAWTASPTCEENTAQRWLPLERLARPPNVTNGAFLWMALANLLPAAVSAPPAAPPTDSSYSSCCAGSDAGHCGDGVCAFRTSAPQSCVGCNLAGDPYCRQCGGPGQGMLGCPVLANVSTLVAPCQGADVIVNVALSEWGGAVPWPLAYCGPTASASTRCMGSQRVCGTVYDVGYVADASVGVVSQFWCEPAAGCAVQPDGSYHAWVCPNPTTSTLESCILLDTATGRCRLNDGDECQIEPCVNATGHHCTPEGRWFGTRRLELCNMAGAGVFALGCSDGVDPFYNDRVFCHREMALIQLLEDIRQADAPQDGRRHLNPYFPITRSTVTVGSGMTADSYATLVALLSSMTPPAPPPSARCSNYPACSGLSGDCCPSGDTYLECCFVEGSPPPPTPMGAPPPPPSPADGADPVLSDLLLIVIGLAMVSCALVAVVFLLQNPERAKGIAIVVEAISTLMGKKAQPVQQTIVLPQTATTASAMVSQPQATEKPAISTATAMARKANANTVFKQS